LATRHDQAGNLPAKARASWAKDGSLTLVGSYREGNDRLFWVVEVEPV
jgi:hypothetical protein